MRLSSETEESLPTVRTLPGEEESVSVKRGVLTEPLVDALSDRDAEIRVETVRALALTKTLEVTGDSHACVNLRTTPRGGKTYGVSARDVFHWHHRFLFCDVARCGP